MNGFINLNKPTGVSSARALDRVRRITRERRSGHAGALDPAADGVLVICLGSARKLVEAWMDQPKVYRAEIRLDATSPGFDSEGELTPVEIAAPPLRAGVAAALAAMEGVIEQVPPARSAVKVGGIAAYRIARRGGSPPLAARPVTIHWIVLREYEWPTLRVELACGRGTYVRAVARDLGVALGTGGCLTSLTRVAVGPFAIADAWGLEALERATPDDYLIPIERVRERLSARPIAVPPRPAP